MSLTITARFALGTYQGRSPAKIPELFPENDRLFAAFVAAAGSGPYAEDHDGILRPAERHRAALEWLENNPPKWISIPPHRANAPGVTAYRYTGNLTKGAYSSPSSADAVSRTSFKAPLTWRWSEQPPAEVYAALAELAAEVAYLGEANSLVVVDVLNDDSELVDPLELLPESALFPAAGVPVGTPTPGRLLALEEAHDLALPKRLPRSDSQAKSDGERQAVRPDAATVLRWYRPADVVATHGFSPWKGALILEARPSERSTVWPPEPTELVGWSVALHRALARTLSPETPNVLTGRYPDGSSIPANRVAIHVVSRSDPLGWSLTEGINAAFALLLPSDISPIDEDAVVRAAHMMVGGELYRGSRGALRITAGRLVDGSEFWAPPNPSLTRVWVPRPLAIAETRRQRRKSGNPWGINEAALLSVGMVWRDLLEVARGGGDFYEDLVRAASRVAQIRNPRQVAGQELVNFVHRTNKSTVLTAYTALFRFSDEVEARAPVAIGQSRHLGAGLLVPADLPGSLLDGELELPWP